MTTDHRLVVIGVIHHIPDPKRVLEAALRGLKNLAGTY